MQRGGIAEVPSGPAWRWIARRASSTPSRPVPTIKIIRTQSGDFTRSKGKEVMESFIKAENSGKNICAVYAHNDDMAIGAIQAIKEAGLKPGKGYQDHLHRRRAGYFQGDDRRRSQCLGGAHAEYGRPRLRCPAGL